MIDSYTVERHKHGIVVKGPFPVGDMGALAAVWAEYGYDLIDTFLAKHFDATLVVTTEEKSELWRKQLGLLEIEVEVDIKLPESVGE